jgi:UDP-glucose 4-epimerase
MKGECIEIWGDGKVIRDYVYIDDVVDAMLRVVEYKGNGQIFNLGSGVGSSLIDIIETIKDVTGQEVEHKFLPGRLVDVPVNVLDVNHIRKELGWAPITNLGEGIGRLFHEHKMAGS